MDRFDVVVVGAGHAGIEAALASARLGKRTACITLDLNRIGHLPCNCSIGGPAKGHLSREIDALGGQMGVTTDYTLTHIRRVGTGKGPAVQTVRAHVCKHDYPLFMQQVIREQSNLTLIQGQVERVVVEGGRVSGVILAKSTPSQPSFPTGEEEFVPCSAVVLTTGTFLNGLCHEGTKKTVAARHGDRAVSGMSAFLLELGVNLKRFKTGTTPRIRLGSIDFSKAEQMESEPQAGAISFMHDAPFPKRALLPCWKTATTSATHALLQERLHESAMYSGQIEGVGPRYCPSIEDKIVKFAEKESHPIFFEIEEWDGESVYIQGFSTSLPADTQLAAIQTIPGLERAEFIRPGYAVEYDMADPIQLGPTLMSKLCDGLFLAGQVNGTSGYEEAAAQGLVAGINAAHYAGDHDPMLFPRDNSFIGVMIDDLITKGVEDPYRMLTARAEHRLLLRHDNADRRLTPIARRIGLCDAARWERFSRKQEAIARGSEWLANESIHPGQNDQLDELEVTPVRNKMSLFEFLRRPEITLSDVERLHPSLVSAPPDLSWSEVRAQLELTAKFEGYFQMQEREVARQVAMERLAIPAGFDYGSLTSLSYESVEKLTRVRPTTIGQASRVPGVRPSDIALLIGFLRGGTVVRS